MKTIIIYSTKHNFTKKCAELLSEKLQGQVELFNLRQGNEVNLKAYDKVILGGSIYMGQIQKQVSQYCLENLNELKEKKLGLFICCMQKDDSAVKQLNEAFPQELVTKAVAKNVFGGGFSFSSMNFFEKLITRKVAKVKEDTSVIFEKNIMEFAERING